MKLDAKRATRLELVVALALTVVLAAVHIARLFYAGPLWRDEISTLKLATLPWAGFWSSLFVDPFPLLFFFTARGWHFLVGDSDFSLRLLGCLMGLLVIAAFWLSTRLMGRKTPTLALVLLGFCPTLFIWGDTIRAYGLGSFWVVLAFALFWRVEAQPGLWTIVSATVAAVCSVQTVYTNALLIFACGMAACFVAVRRRAWKRAGLVLLPGAVAALSLLPYVPVLQETGRWASGMRVDFSYENSLRMLAAALLGLKNPPVWIWIGLAGLGLGIGLLVQFRPRVESRDYRDQALYALVAALLGFAATMVFFRVVGWGTNIWYYLPMLTVIALSLDTLWDFRAQFSILPALRAVGAVVYLLVTLPFVYDGAMLRLSNLDLIARTIEARAAPGDFVVILPYVEGITFDRYFHGTAKWTTIPQLKYPPYRPSEDLLIEYRRPDAIRRVLASIDQTLRAGNKVWIACSWPMQIPAAEPPPVLPLEKFDSRPLGYFFWRWQDAIAYELNLHAIARSPVVVSCEQPVSIYENSRLAVFSGWKEKDNQPGQ
jgi:hypothetical protein